MYEKNGEWSGYSIQESETGWIIEGWSRVQGCTTDYKYLLPYENMDYKQGTDLHQEHSNFFDVGEYLFEMCKSNYVKYKVLNEGYKVQ